MKEGSCAHLPPWHRHQIALPVPFVGAGVAGAAAPVHAEQSHEDAVDVDVEPLAVVEEDEPLDVLDLDEEEDDLELLFFLVA